MSWQPIDTQPNKGGPFLLYYPATKPARGGHSANSLRPMLRIGTSGETPFRKPTHWMPLPAPPEDE